MASRAAWLCIVAIIGLAAAPSHAECQPSWAEALGQQLQRALGSWGGPLARHAQAMEALAEQAGARVGPPRYDRDALGAELAAQLGNLGDAGARHPVLLVPSLGGSQFEVQASNKPDVPWFACKHTFPRTLGWLNFWMLFGPWQACWADNMRLECDENGNDCRSPMGVSVGPVRSLDAALYVDQFRMFGVYDDLAYTLERAGWTKGKDLVAHIYDTRLPPSDHGAPGGAFGQLRQQIEGLVAAAGGRPAVLVGASLAPRYLAEFLQHAVDGEWRAKHVAALVSVSGAWGGAPYYPLTMLSGVWGGRWGGYFSRDAVRKLAAGTPALSWAMPAAEAFGARPLFSNGALNTSYAAADMGVLLRTAELHQAAAVYERLGKEGGLRASRPPADVPLYCLYGTQADTVGGATFASGSFRDDAPSVVTTDGDGIVPQESLGLCRDWRAQAEQQRQQAAGGGGGEGGAPAAATVVVVEFPGYDHANVLHSEDAVRWVLHAVKGAHAGANATATRQ